MKRLWREKANIFILVLPLTIFLFFSIYAGIEAKAAPSSKKIGRELIGKTAPDFVLDSITGKSFKLSSTRGKVVLIDFWHVY